MASLMAALDRRCVLAGVGAVTAGLGAPSLARAQAPALSFATPEENVRTMARLTASLTPGETGHVRYTGKSFAILEEGAPIPLFGLDGMSSVRAEAQPGGAYRFLFAEFAVATDLATGAPLQRWLNPMNGRTVDVWTLRNGPVNYTLSPNAASSAAFTRLGAAKNAGFQLPWQVYGDRATMSIDSTSNRANALDPAVWPLESSGKTLPVVENSSYVIPLAELEHPTSPTLSFVATLESLKPWSPWMLMGQRPGRILTRTTARRVRGLEDFPPEIRRFAEREVPQFLTSPDHWTGEYQTTFAIYAATHTPQKDHG